MKILIDVDNVVADLGGALGFKPEELIDYSFARYPNAKEIYEKMNNKGFWDSLPMMPDAQKAIRKLKRLNHKVVFVTAPWHSYENWMNERRNWLVKNFGPNDLIFTAAKHHVGGDMFIDDKLGNLINYRMEECNRDTDVVRFGEYPYSKGWMTSPQKSPFRNFHFKDWKDGMKQMKELGIL